MKPGRTLHSDDQLLIGRVRSMDESDQEPGGDIVIMRERRDGVERLKIFQRDRQSEFAKFFYRIYDSGRGNVNCTALIEKKAESPAASISHLKDNPLLKLQSALRNVRREVEEAPDICQRSEKLHGELIRLGILSDDSFQYAEVSEPSWDTNTLDDELLSNFSALLPEAAMRTEAINSWEWLARCREPEGRVFTFREMTRAQEILHDLEKKTPNPTRPQARVLREMGRVVACMERHLIRTTSAPVVDDLYRHILRGADYFTPRTFENEMKPLLSALEHPEQPVSLAKSHSLQQNLALLNKYWSALADAPELKFELMPLIFKVEQSFAERIKIYGRDLALEDLPLKQQDIQSMADDIRRCIAEEKTRTT